MTNLRASTLAIALFVLPVAARAQPNVDEARRHADAGQAALAANDFQRALEEYRTAHRLFPNALLLINVARAQSGLSRNADAIRTLQEVLAAADVDVARKREVEAEVQRLRGLVGTIRLAVTPEGATVRLNEEEVANTAEPILVDPGRVDIVATLDGYRQQSWSGHVGAGEQLPVPLALQRDDGGGGGGQGGGEGDGGGGGDGGGDVVTPPPGGGGEGGGSKGLLLVTGIGAGVLGVTSLVMGAVVGSQHCNGVGEDCPSESAGSLNALRYTADIIGVVALVSAGVFVVVLATGGDAGEAAETALAEPGVLRF